MGNLILFLKNAVGIKNCIIALCILLILGVHVFTHHNNVIKQNTHEESLVASTFKDSNNAKDTADDPESNKEYLEFNNQEVVGGQDYDSYSSEDDDVIIDIEHDDNLKYLQPNLIPAIVHFVWCGDRCFEFRHYLAMKSAIRLIRPDKIVFHYETLPVMDKRYYNQWFELLKHDYEFLYVQQMNNATVRMCSADHKSYTEHVINLLNDEGGMYMGISTILTNFSVEHRKVDVAYGLEEAGTEGFLLMRAGIWDNIRVTSQNSLEYDEHLRTEPGACCTLLQYQENPSRCQDCLVPRGDAYKTIKPFDIWERGDAVGRLVRKIFYNTEEMLVPQPSYDSLVSMHVDQMKSMIQPHKCGNAYVVYMYLYIAYRQIFCAPISLECILPSMLFFHIVSLSDQAIMIYIKYLISENHVVMVVYSHIINCILLVFSQ